MLKFVHNVLFNYYLNLDRSLGRFRYTGLAFCFTYLIIHHFESIYRRPSLPLELLLLSNTLSLYIHIVCKMERKTSGKMLFHPI